MFYILIFFIVLGFWFLNGLNAKKILKKNQFYTLAKAKQKQMYFEKNFLVCLESKKLLEYKPLSFVKMFDKTLCKLRYNAPIKEGYISKEIIKELGIKLPVYVMDKNLDEDFSIINLACQFENASIVKPCELDLDNKNNVKFLSVCKFLNVNYEQKNFQVMTNQNFFNMPNIKQNFSKLYSSSFVTQFENESFLVTCYDYFVGEKIKVINILNKSNSTQKLKFSYLLDLALLKINYLYFKRYRNFIKINSIFSLESKYLNFSSSPNRIDYNFTHTQNSNIPCVNMHYESLFFKGEEKKFLFMYSQKIVTLKFFNDKVLDELSNEYLQDFFGVKIYLGDCVFGKELNFDYFFNYELENSAKLELFENKNNAIKIFGGTILSLIKRYKDNEITALSCYFSIRKNFVLENETAFIINPFFLNDDYKIILNYKQIKKEIKITRKNLQKPCLIVNNVRYFGSLTINKNYFLSNYNFSVEY